MSITDLTIGELKTQVLLELKESTSGSDAFPDNLILNNFNLIYEDIFNQPNKQIKLRNAEFNFNTVADIKLASDLNIGDTSIVLADSSNLPVSGRVLIEDEFIDYTDNNLITTLTVASGQIQSTHLASEYVRKCYVLPTDIDLEKVQFLTVKGIPYYQVDVSEILDRYRDNYCNYSVYDGYFVLSGNRSDLSSLLIYTPKIVRFSDTDAIPSLIPNNYRSALLVNGVVGRLMMIDGQRGYEIYYRPPQGARDKGGGLYYDNLRKFYASYGRQSDLRGKKIVRSVYDN